MNFKLFKHAVAKQFERLSQRDLFRVDIDKDTLWAAYLASFPEGTNPIFRKRTEFDCGCCRQFIRAVGDVVGIVDGQIVSLWGITHDEAGHPAFKAVADAMAALVQSRPIANVFLHTERVAGTDRNFEEQVDGGPLTWNHFFINIPSQFVCRGGEIGPRLSETRALHDVLYRSLTELTDDSVDTALDLISQGSLYRGEEHRATLTLFRELKQAFSDRQGDAERHAFVWSEIRGMPGSVSKIRNTSIGTLLVDLSEGTELEQAVRKFEALVAPQNYKRPTALVTPKMIQSAKQALEELGLVSALERRYARLADISVNDILFVDRDARTAIAGDVFDTLATRPNTNKSLDRVEEIPIETFVREIIPRAESIEVLVENRHVPNLVSLIAPAAPTSNNLFKWDNKFSWSYNGDVADSIKERVKQAGGNVTGDLLCRLAWSNYDDLDLHMFEPGGHEIHFRNKRVLSPSGGMLDVDMNAGGGTTRTPVENIFYSRRSTMREGTYQLFIHNWCQRESIDVGFEVEFDFLGVTHHFAYAKAVRHDERVNVVAFKYSHANGVEIINSLPSTQASKTVWGLKTQEFQRVNVLTMSPNCWGEHPIGNRHFFFMLGGCRNDGTARGFYNEFLMESLTPHRKVIEMVGAKMRTEASEDQLSGLGFSSTQRNDVLVRVRGSFTRTVKVSF